MIKHTWRRIGRMQRRKSRSYECLRCHVEVISNRKPCSRNQRVTVCLMSKGIISSGNFLDTEVPADCDVTLAGFVLER